MPRPAPTARARHVVPVSARSAGERRALLYRVVPEATLKRRKDRLSAAESERTERLAGVYARYILPASLAAQFGFDAVAYRLYASMLQGLARDLAPEYMAQVRLPLRDE